MYVCLCVISRYIGIVQIGGHTLVVKIRLFFLYRTLQYMLHTATVFVVVSIVMVALPCVKLLRILYTINAD